MTSAEENTPSQWEPGPLPDWDALTWPQDSDSLHTSHEYCCLVRGIVLSSWLLCGSDLQLQETFAEGYCGEGHKRSTSYQTTSLQTLNCECLQCVFSTDMKMSLFVCVCILLWQSRANCMAEIHNIIQATICTICL